MVSCKKSTTPYIKKLNLIYINNLKILLNWSKIMEKFFQSTILLTLQFNQDNQLNDNQGTSHFDADAAKAGLFEWENVIIYLHWFHTLSLQLHTALKEMSFILAYVIVQSSLIIRCTRVSTGKCHFHILFKISYYAKFEVF